MCFSSTLVSMIFFMRLKVLELCEKKHLWRVFEVSLSFLCHSSLNIRFTNKNIETKYVENVIFFHFDINDFFHKTEGSRVIPEKRQVTSFRGFVIFPLP